MAIPFDHRAFPSTTGTVAAEPSAESYAELCVEPPANLPPEAGRSAGPENAEATKAEYLRMVAKLSRGTRDPHSLNLLGVYQLRLGNVDEAVRIYRGLVLQAGCTWERADVPPVYKRNFATALLLAGLPAGCLAVLHGMGEPDQRRTQQLLAAIRGWERSLTFLQRWDWRLNGIAPKACQIAIDFEPGELA